MAFLTARYLSSCYIYKFSKITTRRSLSVSSMNMEKALENLQNNPFYEKYSARISELQNTSPEEFLARVEQQQLVREAEKKKKFASVDTRQYSSALNPKTPDGNVSSEGEKKLSDIFKIDLVENKDGAEIKAIWEEYHKHKRVICATIPAALFAELEARMRRFPTFLFPLPRANGYEFVLSQCGAAGAVHYTPLLAFQLHGADAPECLTVRHYAELRAAKGLVLMRGEYDQNVLTGQEAQCLANQFQMYYNGKEQSKLELLETFTKSPDSFKHMDLISQLENIGLV